MQTLKSNGTTVALTLFFVLTIAGCGGGSSSRSGASALSPAQEFARQTQTTATVTAARTAATATPKLGSVTQGTDPAQTITAEVGYGSNGALWFRLTSHDDDPEDGILYSHEEDYPETAPSEDDTREAVTIRVVGADNGLPREDVDNPTRLMLPDGTRYRSLIVVEEEREAEETDLDFAMVYTDRQNQADTDYLVGGVWMSVDSDAGGVDQIAAFADSPTAHTPAAYLTTTATATYRGVAYGIGVGRAPAYSWEFQAPVSLTASFGSSPTISGSITGVADRDIGEIEEGTNLPVDFDEFTGREAIRLTLESATISTTAAGGFFTGDVSSPDDDGLDHHYSGKWGGQFYGTQAQSVGGTFGAHSRVNANNEETIMGMFGAYKQ